MTNVLIAANAVTAAGGGNGAFAQGGGVANTGTATLQRTLVIGNRATATGTSGAAQGGGIWNDTFGGTTPSLTLVDSVVTGNVLAAGAGVPAQGGGLFTEFPLTLTRTAIVGNRPDQCEGC